MRPGVDGLAFLNAPTQKDACITGSGQSGQDPVDVVVTLARPVALTLTTRSWLPALGSARQTVRVATVAPTAMGLKSRLLAVPDIR
ncbi:hypothetical protein D3C72_1673470 [compost metagenome]